MYSACILGHMIEAQALTKEDAIYTEEEIDALCTIAVLSAKKVIRKVDEEIESRHNKA